jgi:hypothetical protein
MEFEVNPCGRSSKVQGKSEQSHAKALSERISYRLGVMVSDAPLNIAARRNK